MKSLEVMSHVISLAYFQYKPSCIVLYLLKPVYEIMRTAREEGVAVVYA